jgi:GT2 family glycosyltransferase
MPPRILLGIATGGSPAEPFLDALAKLRLPPGVARLERSLAFGNFIPAQRELIMDDALAGGYDYLFFVDDDIVLPEHALTCLVETAEADPATAVAGGLYYTRDALRPVAVAGWHSDATVSAHVPAFTATSNDEADGVGFGCALLRVAVARTLTPPYFPAHVFVDRATRRVYQCDEDYRYCERVRHAGHRVRLDARVRCAHYDRASRTAVPPQWESDAQTGHPRMVVAQDGTARLVPLDSAVPQARETHVPAGIDYIFVDEREAVRL